MTELTEQIQASPKETFADLVRLYQGDVRMLVIRHVGIGATADDLSQDVFLHAYRSLKNYRGEGSIRAWLLGITRNLIYSHFRENARNKKNGTMEFAVAMQDWRLSYFDQNLCAVEDQQMDLDALSECVKKLGKKHHQMVQQFYFEGKTAEMLAREQRCKPSAVRMMLLRIRSALRKCIRRKMQLGADSHEA